MTEFENNVHKVQFEKAKQKAFLYLSARAHSKKELITKLSRHFELDVAQEVVCFLENEMYVDDEKYAIERAKHLAAKRKSAYEIKADLLCKGIDVYTAEQAVLALEDFSETTQCQNIIKRSYKSKLDSGQSDKVINALLRRGFSYSIAKKAVLEYINSNE